MADRDLGKADLAGDRCNELFMSRITIGMHEDDGDRTVARIELRLKVRAHRRLVRLRLDFSVGTHAFVDFHDRRVEQFGLHDLLGKDVGSGLITDRQRIFEAACGDEQRPLALALQQRIGGDGRSHFNSADQFGRNRLPSFDLQQLANALHGSIAIGFGIFRKDLVGHKCPIRLAPNDIGKCAAAVDPEIPLVLRHAMPP